ncbi:hypothetical protein EDP1_1858 [Pseudomonas putida S610]|nr:hypothetical protein EDP1_1858 [Pseudomonas putida S610]
MASGFSASQLMVLGPLCGPSRHEARAYLDGHEPSPFPCACFYFPAFGYVPKILCRALLPGWPPVSNVLGAMPLVILSGGARLPLIQPAKFL